MPPSKRASLLELVDVSTILLALMVIVSVALLVAVLFAKAGVGPLRINKVYATPDLPFARCEKDCRSTVAASSN